MQKRPLLLPAVAVLALSVLGILSGRTHLKSFAFSAVTQPTSSANTVRSNSEIASNSNSSHIPIVPAFKELPTCQDGCVLFFLHIPKTGGTALGKTLKQGLESRGMLYEVARNLHKSELPYWKNKTARFCPKHRKRILVLELHTNNAPTFQSLEEEGFMDELKKTAMSCGLPFFAFTLLRESVSLDVSFFNHQCLRSHLCGDDIQEATVDNLLDFHPGNLQCHFFKDWPQNNRPVKTNYSQEECDNTFNKVTQHMDWIGALERYNETIAVLEHVTQQNLRQVVWNLATENNEVMLERRQLNDTVVRILQEDSAWDRMFYNRIKQDYTLDKFALS